MVEISDWALVATAAILAAAYLVNMALERRDKTRCYHKWENMGGPTRWQGEFSVSFVQNVRCTKCGKNTWQYVGGPGE